MPPPDSAPPDSAPGSTSSLRTANQRRVLDVLRRHRVGHKSASEVRITQADLARATGLAPATVSNIVREFAAAGLVEVEPGSGRRGTSVRLASRAGLVCGTTSLGRTCCGNAGAPCIRPDGADCCGALRCVGNVCAK